MRERITFRHRGTTVRRISWALLAGILTGMSVGSILLQPPAGAVVQGFSPMGAFNGVACSSSTQCLGVGGTFSGAGSGAAAPLDPATGALSGAQSVQTISSTEFLTAVSCPSSAECLAVGENPGETEGVAVTLDPATGAVLSGQSVQTIPGVFMLAVSCASTTQCLAVGHGPSGAGLAVPLDPDTGEISSGQSVQTILGIGGVGLEGVSCPSATQCLAVGENAGQSAGAAVPLNPATGSISGGQSAQDVTTKGILTSVSCPTNTQCLAVGWGASEPSIAVPIDPATGAVPNGQSDQTISVPAAMLTAVICPSVSQCLAVGNDAGDPSTGQAVPLDLTTGTISSGQSIQNIAGTGALNGLSCPATTQCLAAGATFAATGAVTVVLNAATAVDIDATPPAATTTTTPATTSPPAALTTAPVATPGVPALAVTGVNQAALFAVGLGLVGVGVAMLELASRRRPRRNAVPVRHDGK
jgi:hypothetical protein